MEISARVHEIQDTYAQLDEMDSGLIRGWKPYTDVIDKIRTVSRVTASTYGAKLKDWTQTGMLKDRSFLKFVDEIL